MPTQELKYNLSWINIFPFLFLIDFVYLFFIRICGHLLTSCLPTFFFYLFFSYCIFSNRFSALFVLFLRACVLWVSILRVDSFCLFSCRTSSYPVVVNILGHCMVFFCQVWHRRTFQPSGLFAARIDLQGTKLVIPI